MSGGTENTLKELLEAIGNYMEASIESAVRIRKTIMFNTILMTMNLAQSIIIALMVLKLLKETR